MTKLQDLHKASDLTREQLRERLGLKFETSLSQYERTLDKYLDHLQAYVWACGGELEVVAVVGKRRIRLHLG